MINDPTCFKSVEGKCIDLLLTNRKHSFQHTNTFETGFSDHHVMMYTMFKTTFSKGAPKILKYRCYKKFSEENFFKDLSFGLRTVISGDYLAFEALFTKILNRHAPLKTKILRGNNKPIVNKSLRKAISTRSRLRNTANRTGDPADIAKYKKQRNIVKYLNDKTQKEYFKTLDLKKVDLNKKFWKTFKPFFSSKYDNRR